MQRILVPAGHGRTVVVRAGQTVTVVDVEGQQAADFIAVALADPKEKLSPPHTRRALGSLFFRVGDELRSSRGRPMLRVLEDTVGVHDAQVPPCDATRYSVDFGVDGHRNCLDNLAEGLAAYGLTSADVPETFNLFQNGPVTPDGRMRVTDPASRPGDRVTMLALVDLVVGVSSCPQDIIPGNGLRVTPIEVVVASADAGTMKGAGACC